MLGAWSEGWNSVRMCVNRQVPVWQNMVDECTYLKSEVVIAFRLSVEKPFT